MNRHGKLTAAWRNRQILIMVALFLPVWTLVAEAPALGAPNFFPSEIENLEMGSNPDALIGKLKDSGAYVREEVPGKPGFRMVWTPPQGSYYQTVTFYFTKKDRLYMIGFTLADPRRDAAKIKKAFFEKYGFLDEDPMRFNRKSTDTLLYGPGKMNNFFFEQTDTKTGQKSFELMRRGILGEDTMKKPPAEESPPAAETEPAAKQEQPAADAPKENVPQPEKRADDQKGSEADKTSK